MALPPAHVLVGIGVAEVVRAAAPLPRGPAWVAAAGLAILPDMDLALGIVLGRGAEYHGTFTHSLVAIIAVMLLAWARAGGRWAAVVGAGYGSHVLVDLMNDQGRTNVLLGWPFSDDRSFAIARIFPTVPIEADGGPLSVVLWLLQPRIFELLLLQTAIGALFFLGLLALAWVVRGARRSPEV